MIVDADDRHLCCGPMCLAFVRLSLYMYTISGTLASATASSTLRTLLFIYLRVMSGQLPHTLIL